MPLAPASVPILVGFGPVDPALVAELLPRVLVRRLMVDPAGTVSAVDPSPLRLDETFTAAVPQPPAPTAAYAPTARQRRVVQARDLHCTFPGCAVSSTRCDLDHLTAWAQGGPTAVSNLHALCRHHHRLKHDGWHLTQTPDGTTTWNSPRGRAYQAPSAR